MLLKNGCPLTYCTNIHSGESWKEHRKQLEKHLPAIRKMVSPGDEFGVGLRLSALAGEALSQEEELKAFKNFLTENNLFVFTLNGFPYGQFHQGRVKDKVHQPDWQTSERVAYTKNLFNILQELIPEGLDGGISTSPLSYRPWFDSKKKLEGAISTSLSHLLDIVVYLYKIKAEKGVHLHLDIEPEPDGILENTDEVIHFYKEWLLPKGTPVVAKQLGVNDSVAEEAIRSHIQVCYDVCHFALVYEDPAATFQKFKDEGIGIGKIQLSAALKTAVAKDTDGGKAELKQFQEDVYLHQVITRDPNGIIKSYRDLPQAFQECPPSFAGEWRVHFHVPLFIERYGSLSSTQQEVTKVLDLIKEQNMLVHLEVETYTWDVLPEALKQDIDASIARELEWVVQHGEK